MKIRSDFVSNSSSSSYIISTDANCNFNAFVNGICEACVHHRDDEDELFIQHLNESNARNLNFHLNSTELLFLGVISIDSEIDVRSSIDGTLIYETGSLKYSHELEMLTVNSDQMEGCFHRYSFRKDGFTNDEMVKLAKDIIDYAINAERSVPYYASHSRLFEITDNTIKNTEDLIKLGVISPNSFYRWIDLQDFKKRLSQGERLFGITLNQGGNGMFTDTIYGLGGWAAAVGPLPNATILTCYS